MPKILSKVIVVCNLVKIFLQKQSPDSEKVVSVQSVLNKGMENRIKVLKNDILYADCTILDPRFRTRGFKNKELVKSQYKVKEMKSGEYNYFSKGRIEIL